MTKKMILFGRITGLLKVYFEKEEIYIWLTPKNSNITVNDNAEYRFAIQSYFLWLTKKTSSMICCGKQKVSSALIVLFGFFRKIA